MPCTVHVLLLPGLLQSQEEFLMKTLIDLMNVCQCRMFSYVKTIKMWGINGTHFIHYILVLFLQLLLQCLQGGSVF